jgi:uncharacterized protein with HEPN domain
MGVDLVIIWEIIQNYLGDLHKNILEIIDSI